MFSAIQVMVILSAVSWATGLVYGQLEGHYRAYTMVTCQQKEINLINLYFHAFYNQNIKFFTSHN